LGDGLRPSFRHRVQHIHIGGIVDFDGTGDGFVSGVSQWFRLGKMG
jgi:hypothetical protein